MSEFAVPEAPVKAAPPAPPPLPYEKPSWSGPCVYNYRLEVLKNGTSIESIKGPANKEFVTLGRLPLCDILMEHPSISRYHAIIQFDQDGDAYLYDLDSAHGTRLNKNAVPAREYVQLKPGDQIRFGESTRLCIFDSEKPYDPEEEALERRKIALKQRIANQRGESVPTQEENEGISWGFTEDAEEMPEEEEGDEKEADATEIEANLDKSGDASLLNVEAEKMAFEDAKRRRQDLEIMYGDDSDEELYDKTKKKSKKVAKAETHDELVAKEKKAMLDIKLLEEKIEEKKRMGTEKKEEDDEDLDAFMSKLAEKPLQGDKSLFVLQRELTQLKK
ncbi:hypothetical protein INT47_011558, partial [Mucor saturninus]